MSSFRKKNPQDIARRIIEKMAAGGLVEDESHEIADDDNEDMFSDDLDLACGGMAFSDGGEVVDEGPVKKASSKILDRIRAKQSK